MSSTTIYDKTVVGGLKPYRYEIREIADGGYLVCQKQGSSVGTHYVPTRDAAFALLDRVLARPSLVPYGRPTA